MTSPFALAGHYVDEFIDPASRAETLQSSFGRLVEAGEPGLSRGRSWAAPGRHARELSRLSLPLAADGRTVDMPLLMTTYVCRRWLLPTAPSLDPDRYPPDHPPPPPGPGPPLPR